MKLSTDNLIKSFCGGPGGGFFKKSPLAAGGSRLLHPIHGRGILQHSNIISNLNGCRGRMVPDGGIK
jgi:hypothetical protein